MSPFPPPPSPPPTAMLRRRQPHVCWIFNIGKRDEGPESFFVVMLAIAKPSQQLLSMVVHRLSTFPVGVSTRSGDKFELTANYDSINW